MSYQYSVPLNSSAIKANIQSVTLWPNQLSAAEAKSQAKDWENKFVTTLVMRQASLLSKFYAVTKFFSHPLFPTNLSGHRYS